VPPAAAPKRVESVWGRDGFGFDDLVDIVNPLQHLPGVGQLYRHLTGDELGMLPRLAGGLLFGGPLGAATAMITGGIEAGTGRTPGEHALAALQGEPPTPSPSPSQVARAYAPPQPPEPTPHAVGAGAAGAAAGTAEIDAGEGVRPLAPTLSGTRQRLLAELATGTERSARTSG
jgi:hypothetical protein